MVSTVESSFRALVAMSGGRSLTKYQQWWLQEPRDEFGKWTSGFVGSAFAEGEPDEGSAESPAHPKLGNQDEPGWMGSMPQTGVSGNDPALAQATGESGGFIPSKFAFEKPQDMAASEAASTQLSAHINAGDFDQAKALVAADPSVLYHFRKKHHGSVKDAKKAAAFLNAVTDATWVQHGTFVNKPKMQPPKAPLEPASPQVPEPKVPGAPKLIPFDVKAKPPAGSVAAMKALADAHAIHEKLGLGDVAGARKIAQANPQSLHALYGMKHGTVLAAKSAAAFLHLVTGQNFAQHGTAVNMPKGPLPKSSWQHSFSGTGAPGYDPSSLTGNTAPQAPSSVVPPPGIMPPPKPGAQANVGADTAESETSGPWQPVEAKEFAHAKVGGTNPGGFFQLADGTKGYAKFYSNAEQMQTEALANSLYRAMGINAPDSKLVTINGKKAIFSPLIEGGKQLQGPTADSTAKLAAHPQVKNGFALDAILGNRDVLGLTHDNIMFTPDGQAHRMDNGGSLKYRAQGSIKNDYGPDVVSELDSMRDPKHGAGAVFKHLDTDQVIGQIANVASTLTPEKIAELTAKAGFTGKDAVEHGGTIVHRVNAALKWAVEHTPDFDQKDYADICQKFVDYGKKIDESATPPDVPSGSAPNAPLGNKLLEGVNKSVDLKADDALTSTHHDDTPLSYKAKAAIANNDGHAFAQEVTASPGALATAAQRTWLDEKGGKWMAEILTHLTGKPHHILNVGNGWAITAPHLDGDLGGTPVVAHAPDKLSWTQVNSGSAANLTYYDNVHAKEALAEWQMQGASAASVANLPLGAAQSLAMHSVSTPEKAKAIAGLLSYKTGYHYGVVADGGGFKAAPIGGATPPPMWAGEHHGYPNPAEYDPTKGGMPGVSPQMTTAEHFQQVSDLHHDAGNHVLADWVHSVGEAQGHFGEPNVDSAATPAQNQQMHDMSLASQINYLELGADPTAQHEMAKKLDEALAKPGESMTPELQTKLNGIVKGVVDDPDHAAMSALAHMKYQSLKKANAVVEALKAAGVKGASVGEWPDGKNKINIPDGITANHLASAKHLLPGIHAAKQPQSDVTLGANAATVNAAAPPTPTVAPKPKTGNTQLFTALSPGTKPVHNSIVEHYKKITAAIAHGKLSASNAAQIGQNIANNEALMHHLSTVPMTKLTADRFEKVLEAAGVFGYVAAVKKYNVPKGSQFNSVLFVLPKADGSAQQQSPSASASASGAAKIKTGGFDKQFVAAHGGGSPLTSTTPVGIMALHSQNLPAGVGLHDVVEPDPEKRAQKIAQLKAQGQDESANFLNATHANLDQAPKHHLHIDAKIYLGGTKKLVSPYKTPHEVLHQLLTSQGNKVMPDGVTATMLHASTPEDRALASAEAGKNSYEGRQWLEEYYRLRDQAHEEAKSGGVFVPGGMKPTGGYSTLTAHPDFFKPDAFGATSTPQTSAEHLPLEAHIGTQDAFKIPTQQGNISAHADSLTPQRTAPIIGESGQTHAPTHLSHVPGATATPHSVGLEAAQKAADVILPLLHEHQGAMGAGKDFGDPFGDLPKEDGVHIHSAHAHELARSMFKPMLEAARAATPSEGVLRAMSQDKQSTPAAQNREVARAIYNAMAPKLGISVGATKKLANQIGEWKGSTQDEAGGIALRVATNLLRGRTPHENAYLIGHNGVASDKQAAENARTLAKSMSPDYLKALLLHKAITQAMAERHADDDGDLAYARGISSGPSEQMLGSPSASEAIASGKSGQWVNAHEQGLAGYAPGVRYSGSTFLHRIAKPEAVWHQYRFSPQHAGSSYSKEEESFLTSNGGGAPFKIMASHPGIKGNWATPDKAEPFYQKWWGKGKKLFKAATQLAALADRTMRTGNDHGIPLPTTRADWNRWVPPDFAPSEAMIDAYLATMMDPDGTIHLPHGYAYEAPTV